MDPFTAERYSPQWMNWVGLFLLLDRTYVGVRQLLIGYCRYSYILQTVLLASGFLPKVLKVGVVDAELPVMCRSAA